MKITSSRTAEPPINWRELPKGTVIRFRDGIVAMVYLDKAKRCLLLLNFLMGDTWLDQAEEYEEITVVEVLVVISGIVVE